jgi:hypothetical protein
MLDAELSVIEIVYRREVSAAVFLAPKNTNRRYR